MLNFRKISAASDGAAIRGYMERIHPLDKAGAFAIQGLGAVIIKEVQGDFMGAMGLPLFILARELKKFGVNVL